MKRILGVILSLCMLALPISAQPALHGHASNLNLQTPINYVCFPVNGNGQGAPAPYTCSSQTTVIQTATTFTSLTAIISRPVEGSHRVAIIAEDFTTGNNIGVANCVITAGQQACSVAIPSAGSVSAGDLVAVKIWDDLTGTNYYNVEDIWWVLQ